MGAVVESVVMSVGVGATVVWFGVPLVGGVAGGGKVDV